MKGSIIIVLFFVAGAVTGIAADVPILENEDFSTYVLYALLFLVGISVGADRKTIETLRNLNLKIVLVPMAVVIGSLMGGFLGALFLTDMNVLEGLLVSAGFGYYSLSSILITNLYSEALGVVALLSNVIREIVTLLAAPHLARYFSRLAPIAAGGATAMDTTLPIITLTAGKEYALISVFSGFVLTVLVPILVTFLISIA